MQTNDNCQLALSPQDVPILMKTKHPVHIMVLGGVITNDDDNIMPLFLFPHDLKLNTDVFIKCLDLEGGCWKNLNEWSMIKQKINKTVQYQIWTEGKDKSNIY